MLMNAFLALVPVLGLYVSFLAVVCVLKVLKVFDSEPSRKTVGNVTVLFLIVSILVVISSPMVQPVNTVHDKHNEVQTYKSNQAGEIEVPVLEDRKFKHPEQDPEFDQTPLFDKAMNR